MPEWNLVIHRSRQWNSKQNRGTQRFPVSSWIVLAALVIATQSGCTKLRNAALQDGLVPPSQSAIAERINQEPTRDSVRNYLEANTETLDSPQAKFVGVFEAAESESQPKVTLTARMPGQEPPAPSIASASNDFDPQPLSAAESCTHENQCDCHKTVVAPKLAVVEPFDPTTFAESEPRFTPVAPSIASVELPLKTEVDAKTTLPDRFATNTNDPSARGLLQPILAKNPLPQNQPSNNAKTASKTSGPAKQLVPLRPLAKEGESTSTDATIVLQAKSTQSPSGVIKLNAQASQSLVQTASLNKETASLNKVVVAEAEVAQDSSSDLKPSATNINELAKLKDVTPGAPWSPLREIRVGEISPEQAFQASTPTIDAERSEPSTDVAMNDAIVAPTPEERLSPKVEPIADSSFTPPTKVVATPRIVIQKEVEEEVIGLKPASPDESSIAHSPQVDTSSFGGGNFSPLDQVADDNRFSPLPSKALEDLIACQCGVPDCECECETTNAFAVQPPIAVQPPVGELYASAVEQFKREMASTNQWGPPVATQRRTSEPPPSSANIFQPKMVSGSPVELPSLDQIDQELAIARGKANEFTPMPLPLPEQELPQPVETREGDVAQVGHAEQLDAPMEASVETTIAVETMQPISLRQQVDETIAKVKFAIANEADVATKNGLEVNLRLLELLNQQTDQLDKNDRMINNDQKRSLQHQLDALSAMLTNETRSMDASATTLDSLKQAVEELESLAEMRVTNGLFCTQISGFGKFKSFATSTFSASQKMLIYCEVENQTSIEVQNGTGAMEHRTKLLGRYVVYDRDGQAVQQEVFPPIEDVARNRRRDFYLYFPIQLKELPAGEYRLELMIEDLNGSKTASLQPGIHFSVQ